jgi:threonine dehydrogenase-like Zn-dependent dehydrogenase
VIAIDRVVERLRMAEVDGEAETIDFSQEDVYERLMEMTNNRGPDACIDAVGAEAHGAGSFDAVLDKVKTSVYLATDRLHVLRQMIMCCRKGGHLSIPGVYLGFVDKLPFGAAFGRASRSRWDRRTHKTICSPCFNASRTARSIHPSSLRTDCHCVRHPQRIKSSAIRKTVASRFS